MTTRKANENKILIVEDDHDIRWALRELLADEGYAVALARHGQEALDAVTRTRPSLILLDLMLPVMDGWTFIAKCRSNPRCREIPIVVLSAAYGLQVQAKRLRDAGVHAVIPKPFDVHALLGTLQRVAPIAS